MRVIRITNVQDGYIVDDSPKYYPLSLMTGLDDYILEENDLLMSLTGNVGRVAMMPASLLPAALNQRVCCIHIYWQVDYSILFHNIFRMQKV